MFATYALSKEYRAQRVIFSKHPAKPSTICQQWFKRGDLIKGELKHMNNQPAIVMTESGWIFPVNVLKEVLTKDLSGAASSGADGSGGAAGSGADLKKSAVVGDLKNPPRTKKVQYLDAIILGGLIGFVAVWAAEKKGWLPPSPDKKNKIFKIKV
jgi:hypothetical protein